MGGVPAAVPVTSTQTSTTAVQVRWKRVPGAIGYRAHYSPAPYGTWPGYYPYTPTIGSTSTGLSMSLPAVGPGDRFMGARYGNPLFFQLETKRCNGVYAKAPFTLAWPKPLPPGDASTGDRLRMGTYNIEAQTATAPTATNSVNPERTSSSLRRHADASSLANEAPRVRRCSSTAAARFERSERDDSSDRPTYEPEARRYNAMGVAPTTCVGPRESRAQATSPVRHSMSSIAGS